MPDWNAAEWAQVLATSFAAVAAIAAAVAVGLEVKAQRRARRPHVSAGFLEHSDGRQEIEFVNGGPGLAIQLGYVGVDAGLKYGGHVGSGHLSAGDKARVAPPFIVTSKRPDFIWFCRDVDTDEHIWSYGGRYKRRGRRDVMRGIKGRRRRVFGDAFREMYPGVTIPSS